MSLITGNKEKIFAQGVVGNVRKAQEDCHGYKLGTPNGDLFVVCDGMGGHVGGAKASTMAVDSIIEYIDKDHYDSPRDALNGALQYANMQILGYADSHPDYKGMGTTACIVLIRGIDIWIAHVGDSRIYLYLGKERELHRLTKDHSYVQTLVDSGEITDEQAEHHPNKNRIMKALGISPDLHPTFNYNDRPILSKNRDVFMICSDGLCGMIPDSTIERVLGEKKTLSERGEELIRLAMEGETVRPGGQDNCTLELIEIDNSFGKKSYFKSYNPASKKREKKSISLFDRLNPKHWLYILSGLVALIVAGLSIWWFNIGQVMYLENECEKAKEDLDTKRELCESAEKEWERVKSDKSVDDRDKGKCLTAYRVAQSAVSQADSVYKEKLSKLSTKKKVEEDDSQDSWPRARQQYRNQR